MQVRFCASLSQNDFLSDAFPSGRSSWKRRPRMLAGPTQHSFWFWISRWTDSLLIIKFWQPNLCWADEGRSLSAAVSYDRILTVWTQVRAEKERKLICILISHHFQLINCFSRQSPNGEQLIELISFANWVSFNHYNHLSGMLFRLFSANQKLFIEESSTLKFLD